MGVEVAAGPIGFGREAQAESAKPTEAAIATARNHESEGTIVTPSCADV